MRAFIAGVLMVVATGAVADDKEKIVGTWKLVSVIYEDQTTKERSPVLGEHPRGRQIATADGRWLALVTGDNRPIPVQTYNAGFTQGKRLDQSLLSQ